VNRRKWDPKNPVAPFDERGLLHYPESWRGIEWRPAPAFDASLRFDDYSRGRSAAYFNWMDDSTGLRYPMFLADLADLIRGANLLQGETLTNRWRVVKRGQNYGIAVEDS
jgi:hypothetical protein